jgi:PAS domain S-box-containing protein
MSPHADIAVEGPDDGALAPEDELQRLILSHINEVVYAVGQLGREIMTGEVVFVSDRVRDIFGYEPDVFLGDVRRWFALVHPADQPSVLAVTREIFLRGSPGTRLYRLRHARTGDWRWVEDVVVPLRDRSGRLTRQFGVLRDVTERVRSDDLLRESERRHRELVEHSHGIILTLDLDGTILSINPAVTRSLGYEPAAVVGRPLTIFVPERSRNAVVATFTQMQEDAPIDGLIPALTATGEERVWAFRAVVRRPEGGTPYVLANAVDITDLKRAESDLRRSEAKYRELVEQAAVGIYRSSPEGRFLSANRALVEMLGYEREEELQALDMARDVYLRPGERDRVLRDYGPRQRYTGVEVDWKRRDGEVIRVRLSGRPILDAAGAVESFEMVAEDVTRHRQLEAQLRQAQKMEAVGQLTSGIAHDFNNVLTAIVSNLDLALDACPPGLTGLREEIVEAARAADRAAQMVRKLLAFGRRQQLEMETLDLAAQVSEEMRMLRRMLPESVAVEVVSDGRPAPVRADRAALQQILLNLATNARDAMPQGGTLRLSTGTATLDAAFRATHGFGAPGVYACLGVSDTGSGIDERHRARIFEPFYTTKPHGAGTGLGLAMVYGLVKQHHGYITVESAPRGGTLFTVYLPLLPEPAGEADAERAEPPPRGTEHLLVVEDDEVVRRTAERALVQLGYRVRTAVDGEDALALLGIGPRVDLVVTDLVMPRKGGVALWEAVRHRAAAPRFLFTSGYAGDETGSLDASLPFLRKPWTTAQLAHAVRRVLDGR